MPVKWYEGIIVDMIDRAPNVRSYFLKVNELSDFFFQPGQFITLDLPVHQKRLHRWRSYSVANLPEGDHVIELCIAKVPEGIATPYLFDLQCGDTLKFKGPDGNFSLPDTPPSELIMVCTGTGVAPFRSMIADLEKRDKWIYPVHLIFGTRKEEGLLYREEWESLQLRQPNFRYTPVLSRQPDWPGRKGYVHQVYLDSYHDPDSGRLFMLCGWTSMIDEAVKHLVQLGYDKSQIRYELYG